MLPYQLICTPAGSLSRARAARALALQTLDERRRVCQGRRRVDGLRPTGATNSMQPVFSGKFLFRWRFFGDYFD